MTSILKSSGSQFAHDEPVVVDSISVSFGGVRAVDNVSLSIRPGERVGIIGPNGSGKSTLINVLSGFIKPDSGRAQVVGLDVVDSSPRKLFLAGLGRTFQETRVFDDLGVFENLLMGAQQKWSLFTRSDERRHTHDRVLEVAALVGLQEKLFDPAGHLSYGQKKLLGIGICIMSMPRVILLDEPFAGVNEVLAVRILDSLILLEKLVPDCSIIIVEHNLGWLKKIAKRLVFLAQGRVIADGVPETVLASKEVIDAYLGEA